MPTSCRATGKLHRKSSHGVIIEIQLPSRYTHFLSDTQTEARSSIDCTLICGTSKMQNAVSDGVNPIEGEGKIGTRITWNANQLQ